MRSGKTTELKRRIDRQTIAKRRCAVIKSNTDKRSVSKEIKIHNDDKFIANFVCDKLASLETKLDDYQIIGIDEGQFFDDLVKFCDKMANKGKIIIVAALDGDSKRKPFFNVVSLVAKAKYVKKLLAVCQKCGKDSEYTMKKGGNDKRIEINDTVYFSVCRKCYFSK